MIPASSPTGPFHSGFVAIVGRPNAGKSTLLNHVLQTELSVVSPKAQTTRDRLFGILTETWGQMVFVDTPGIHRARPGGINAYMVQEAKTALEDPSVIWYLVEPSSELKHEEPVLEQLAGNPSPLFLVWTKSDRPGSEGERARFEERLIQKIRELKINLQQVYTLSVKLKFSSSVEQLLKDTWALLPEGPRYYEDADQLSDRPLRYFAAERIREQLFAQLGDELPYSCAVEIERFDEKVKPLRIEAQIHVERDSQKGMVIGKGGLKIKAIGQAARESIQKFLGQPVFLGLRVRVTPSWTTDRNKMKQLGYLVPEVSGEGQGSHHGTL